MNHGEIRVGMVLKIKADRCEAYGLPKDSTVIVRNIATRNGYKVPWIYTAEPECECIHGLLRSMCEQCEQEEQ